MKRYSIGPAGRRPYSTPCPLQLFNTQRFNVPQKRIRTALSCCSVGQGALSRHPGIGAARLHELVLDQVFLDFFAAHVREHLVVDLDTGRERLAALGFHFPAERRVLDDVFLGVLEIVFGEHGADAGAPAAGRFQVGSNLGRIHVREASMPPGRNP